MRENLKRGFKREVKRELRRKRAQEGGGGNSRKGFKRRVSKYVTPLEEFSTMIEATGDVCGDIVWQIKQVQFLDFLDL